MNNNDQMQRYFDKSKTSEPFIPMENIEPFLLRKTTGRFRKHSPRKRRMSLILLPTAVVLSILALVVFAPGFFVRHAEKTQTLASRSTASPQPQSPAGIITPPKLEAASVKGNPPLPGIAQADHQFSNVRTRGDIQKNPAGVIPVSYSPIAIPPLRIYILDTLELEKIGIVFFDNAFLTTWYGFDNWKFYGSDGTYKFFHHIGVQPAGTGKLGRWYPFIDSLSTRLKISVRVMTDEKGHVLDQNGRMEKMLTAPDLTQTQPSSQSSQQIDFCIDNLDPQLQNLIPIMVRVGNKIRILWMDPAPDLLMSLPERIQHELLERNNRDRIKRNSGPKISKGNDVRVTLRSGDTPEKNPAVELELNSQRNLAMALYDIQGRLVKELAPLQRLEKGICEQEVDVSGVRSGLYLLAILSNSGEHAVQRICVP
jgi:hypothetical protein